MAIDYAKFDKMVDLNGLKKDIEDAKNNTAEYKEVPHGTYEVKVSKMELGESKKGDPMVKIWFKIVEGEYKNSMIFLNQVINQGFQIHIVNDLLRAMIPDMEIEFESYAQYGGLLDDIFEAVDDANEFALEYGENKGFNTFKIVEVFDLE